MQRRTLVAGLGSALLTSGCLGSSRPRGAPPETRSPTEDSEQDTLSESPPGDGTKSPGSKPTTPEDPPSEHPFPSLGCPSFREADVTVCAHTDDQPLPLVLRPDSTTFRIVESNDTVETLGLTLANASGHSFGFNPHDWRVDRYTGDGWLKVAPAAVPEPWTELGPDGHYDYELATSQHPTASDGPHQIVVELTSAIHAVSVIGTWGEEGAGDRVECVALVDVTVESEE